jgi:hypothetical protein
VCGQYDETVFGDKLGKLGEEEKTGQPVYDKFGKLIADKSESKDKSGFAPPRK